VVVQQPGALGAETRDACDLHEAGGDLRLQLVSRRDRPCFEQRVDLLGDRPSDSGELLDAPLLRELLDGHARLTDRLGGVAVGHHAVYHRAVQLVQAGELLESLRYLPVAHALARVRASCPALG
jgi:hypothetical protein